MSVSQSSIDRFIVQVAENHSNWTTEQFKAEFKATLERDPTIQEKLAFQDALHKSKTSQASKSSSPPPKGTCSSLDAKTRDAILALRTSFPGLDISFATELYHDVGGDMRQLVDVLRSLEGEYITEGPSSGGGGGGGGGGGSGGKVPSVVYVICPDSSKYTCEVEMSHTVWHLKTVIQQMSGIPAKGQALIYNGKDLGNDQTLQSCSILNGTLIFLVERQKVNPPLPDGSINVDIKTLDGKTMSFNVKPQDTLLHLKQLVHQRTSVSANEQRLIYGGKQLDEKLTFQDYDIGMDAQIHMVLSLRG